MHYKQNNKESKTYVQGLRPFGNTLPRGIKGILKKNGYNYSEIISKWNLLMGKNISNYCYPKSIKMSRSNKNGTLILSVERGNEIIAEYSKKEIINKINSYFGYEILNNVRIETFNNFKENIDEKRNIISKSSKEKFDNLLKSIKNEKIKKSLINVYV